MPCIYQKMGIISLIEGATTVKSKASKNHGAKGRTEADFYRRKSAEVSSIHNREAVGNAVR